MSSSLFKPKEVMLQSDNQTCLFCCFLTYYSVIFPERDINFKTAEKQLFRGSFGLYPQNYTLTCAAAFARMYSDIKIEINVHISEFSEYLSKLNKEERVTIRPLQITLPNIRDEIRKNPLIVYIDQLYLKGGEVHVPHYIYIFLDEKEQMMIVDPATGKMREIADEELENGIMALRYNMLWSPIVLRLKAINRDAQSA